MKWFLSFSVVLIACLAGSSCADNIISPRQISEGYVLHAKAFCNSNSSITSEDHPQPLNITGSISGSSLYSDSNCKSMMRLEAVSTHLASPNNTFRVYDGLNSSSPLIEPVLNGTGGALGVGIEYQDFFSTGPAIFWELNMVDPGTFFKIYEYGIDASTTVEPSSTVESSSTTESSAFSTRPVGFSTFAVLSFIWLLIKHNLC